MPLADTGITGDSVATGSTLVTILVFLSLALYNVTELCFIIFATFKRRSGLYFWSFVVATLGIVPYSIGFLLKTIQLEVTVVSWVYVTLIVVGWCCMVTGQSVVLYSRLHIVLRNQSQLRFVLGMIIINAIICHVPIAVLVYGANSPNPAPYVGPYSVYERVQVTLFFLQETIISALYIRETVALMRARRRGGMGGKVGSTRWLMTHLIVVNIIIVVLDVTIIALEYAGLYDLQTSYKALVYSVKLKLEFSILNRLVEMTQGGSSHESSHGRTAADNLTRGGVVQMDMLDGETTTTRKKGGNMGNSVSVRTGLGVGAANAPAGGSVVMTTEITVQRSHRPRDLDSERDSDSIGDRSVELEGTVGNTRAPSHSSEQHIVDRRS